MLKYDVVSLLQDNGVDVSHEGKNVSAGWVGMSCPHCGDTSNHLGYSIDGNFFNCWKCGGHNFDKTLMLLLGISKGELRKLLSEYRDDYERDVDAVRTKAQSLELPYLTESMKASHKDYLRDRGFDPEYLENVYDLQGTMHLGDYKYRIIAPIYHKGRLVSYQGRDITETDSLKYKACKKELEVIPHKEMLYAIDLVTTPSIVVVEGIADAWRIGPGAVSTFGIKYTNAQLMLLKPFKNRFILFDSEPVAQKQAHKLAYSLKAFSGETHIINLDSGDPGEMGVSEALNLRKDLGI